MPNKNYNKGRRREQQAVRNHIKQGAIFAGRMAGSKCSGKLKVDVVALYPDHVAFEQYKTGKQRSVADASRFFKVKINPTVKVVRRFWTELDVKVGIS